MQVELLGKKFAAFIFATGVLALGSFCPSYGFAADITFKNVKTNRLYLHMRIGPVATPPDQRGSSNTTIDPGLSDTENVGDGDIWYAYGNQQIGGNENPQLCNAPGGVTVQLDGTQPCFVDN